MNSFEEDQKKQNQLAVPSNIKIPYSHATTQKPELTNGSSGPPSSILTLDSSAIKISLKTKLRVFVQIATSDDELKQKLTLEGSRLGIVFFFAGFFLTKQPYNHSISNFMLNPGDSIKIATEMVFIVLVLISFYCFLKTYEEEFQNHLLPSARKKRNRFFALITFSAVIIAQSLLIIQFFMTFLVEYLVPIFFMLSCLSLMIECGFRKQNLTVKIIFIVLFFLEILGSVAIFLDTLDIMFSATYSKIWKNYILPSMLITSLICAVFTILEYCFISYHENINISMSNCRSPIFNTS